MAVARGNEISEKCQRKRLGEINGGMAWLQPWP